MKVKIITSKYKSYWYNDHIGKIYEVYNDPTYDHYNLIEDKNLCISIDDCICIHTLRLKKLESL